MSNCSVPVPQLPQASCPCLMSEEEKASQSFNVSASLETTQPRGVQFQPHFNLTSLCFYNLSVLLQGIYRFSHISTFYTSLLHHHNTALLRFLNISTSQPQFNITESHFILLSTMLPYVITPPHHCLKIF